jgi:hypothetical protein|tara:strand:- start:422 stop:715 length:294 start_codon:yes stop_codon:yes gene_type:complete
MIKIIKKPEQKFFDNDISATEIVAKFYQAQDNSYNVCKLSVWGSLSHDVMQYYQLNDYLIVEGYISRRNSNLEVYKTPNEIEISVFKIYPFALNTAI